MAWRGQQVLAAVKTCAPAVCSALRASRILLNLTPVSTAQNEWYLRSGSKPEKGRVGSG